MAGSRAGNGAVSSGSESCAVRLAQLFPGATATHLPVQVTVLRRGGRNLHENTILEFSTEREALFVSSLPLEFEDRVRLQDADGSLKAEATVIAVQYHAGRKAVAVRFATRTRNRVAPQ